MKLIFYEDAARLLGISVDTLKQAMTPGRNIFTRAGRKGSRGLLIEEQVRLFVGNNPRTGRKKRLSHDALSADDLATWHRYAREYAAMQARADGLEIGPDVESLIEEKVNEALARATLARLQEEEKQAAQEARRIALEKERVTKDYPFLTGEPALIA